MSSPSFRGLMTVTLLLAPHSMAERPVRPGSTADPTRHRLHVQLRGQRGHPRRCGGDRRPQRQRPDHVSGRGVRVGATTAHSGFRNKSSPRSTPPSPTATASPSRSARTGSRSVHRSTMTRASQRRGVRVRLRRRELEPGPQDPATERRDERAVRRKGRPRRGRAGRRQQPPSAWTSGVTKARSWAGSSSRRCRADSAFSGKPSTSPGTSS